MDQFNHLSPHGDNDEDDEVASAPPAETKPDADNLTLLPNPIRVFTRHLEEGANERLNILHSGFHVH